MPYQLDSGRPVRMYYSDFNRDCRGEIIEAYYNPNLDSYVPRRKRGAFAPTSLPFTSRADSYAKFVRSTASRCAGSADKWIRCQQPPKENRQ